MIMPGSFGFDAGHLLLEGVIEEHEWGVSVAILVGHVLAAGFLLWAFQRVFLANSNRYKPYTTNNQTLTQERLIAFVICTLHIGTGLNSMPLLNLIDKDAIETVSHYPVHGSLQHDTEVPIDLDTTDDKSPAK